MEEEAKAMSQRKNSAREKLELLRCIPVAEVETSKGEGNWSKPPRVSYKMNRVAEHHLRCVLPRRKGMSDSGDRI